jgi:hypothetical protein
MSPRNVHRPLAPDTAQPCDTRVSAPRRVEDVMEPWGTESKGRFDEHTFVSEVLRGNPLGDPHE